MTSGSRADVVRGVTEQMRPILEGSSQGIYIFLDEDHKVCNQAFAELLGYSSPAEWDRTGSFTDLYVDPGSQHRLVSTYSAAMQHQVAGNIEVTWKRHDGSPQPSSVQLVPIAFGSELLALHFVTPQ